jgi:hypothetical protein
VDLILLLLQEPSTGAIEVTYQRTATKKRRQGGGPDGAQDKRRRTNSNDWPGGFANQFLRFVLHKENMDTQVQLTWHVMNTSSSFSTCLLAVRNMEHDDKQVLAL